VWIATDRRSNERWPHRFGIELVEERGPVSAVDVGSLGMDAMHCSANIGGVPLPVDGALGVLASAGPLALGELEDPAFLALDGALDATALVATRREQRRLRAHLFGGRATANCDLCGRELPVDCIRTVHVKKRSVCDERERKDLSNIMAACTLGCDHLFELGYVRVAGDGTITGAAVAVTADLARSVERLAGRACAAHSASSELYFAWHREQVVPA
jgi:hypothetical protein